MVYIKSEIFIYIEFKLVIKKKNFKLYFNSLLYVVRILGLQELNEIYIMRTMARMYEIREVFLKV